MPANHNIGGPSPAVNDIQASEAARMTSGFVERHFSDDLLDVFFSHR